MPGANVIARADGKPRELNQGGTSTSLINFSVDGTVFVRLPVTSARITGSGSSGLTAYTVPVRARAWGRCTGGTTTNYTASLRFGTSTTSISTIEASGAVAIGSANHVWRVEAELIFDSANNRVIGMGTSLVNATVGAVATLDNAITPDLDDASLQYYFFVAGTFSSGDAGNASYLDGFELSTMD